MAVTYISAGAGARATGSSTTLGTSWTHTIATSGANTAVIVGIVTSHSATATGTFTCSATYGGNAMTAVPNFPILASTAATNGAGLAIFYLMNPPTGAQTVTITTGGTTTKASIQGTSVAYSGVQQVLYRDQSVTTTALANPFSNPFASARVGGKSFWVLGHGVTITAVTQTQRYLGGGSVTGYGDFCAITDGDGPGSHGATAASSNRIQGMAYLDPVTPPTQSVFIDSAVYGGQVTTGTALSWSHTASGSDRCVLVGVRRTATGPPASSTVTYGGNSMTLLIDSNAATDGASLYYLLAPPTGAQTITVTSPAAVTLMQGGSASYTGVGSVSGAVSAFGADPLTVSSVVGGLAFGMAANSTNQATLSAAWRWGSVADNLVNQLFVFGDNWGDTSIPFTMNVAAASRRWVGGSLNPISAAAPTGTFFAMF